MFIKVTYQSIDRVRITRPFKTLTGARRFAQKYLGLHPTLGCGYAISDDGIGKITVEGSATLRDLFPESI